MYFGRITAFLLICRVESLLACWGGGKQPDDKNHTRYNPNDKKIWGGWDPPGGAKGAWKEYLLTHHQALYGKGAPYDPALHGPKPYGIGIPGWPPNWNGLGYPLTGMEPPPWAYVPKKIGKPSLCYEPPKLGNCNPKKLLTRYGYNPFLDKCLPYTYTGCNGSRNKFLNEATCIKVCMTDPQSGCEHDSALPIDSFVWARRCGYSDDEPNEYDEIKS